MLLWFVLLFASFLQGAPSPAEDIAVTIHSYRQSEAFRIYEAFQPASRHVYYTFLAWWMDTKLSSNDLDSSGVITKALVEDAAGFGGWNRDKKASGGENTIYSNAAFLHYWQHNNASPPQENQTLGYIKKAADEKQCLLMPHRWLYPTRQVVAHEPQGVASWYRSLRCMGWSMSQGVADDYLNKIFACSNSLSFQKDVVARIVDDAPDTVRNWFDLSLDFAKGAVMRHSENPLEEALRNLIKKKPSLDEYQRCFRYTMEKHLFQCLLFWHGMEQTSMSVFVGEGDTRQVDSDATHLGMVQSLFKSYKGRCSSSSHATIMGDGERKKLWILQNGKSDIPAAILEEACITSGDISPALAQIFDKALKKLQNQKRKYGSLESSDELMRWMADYLAFIHSSNEISQYVIKVSGYIFGEWIDIGSTLDEAQNELAELHYNACLVFQRATRSVYEQLGQYSFLNYQIQDQHVALHIKIGEEVSVHNVFISPEAVDFLRRASAIDPYFYSMLPLPVRERCFQKEHDVRCNMSKGDEATILRNTGRSMDFLIQRGVLPPYEKLRALLVLYNVGML